MAYDSLDALRSAGWFVKGEPTGEVEEILRGLTKEQAEFLISFQSRIQAAMPEVVAHSQDGGQWTTPEATQQGLDAAMLCACGAWSGSGLDA